MGAKQTPLAEGDAFGAAARERSHRGGSAADVTPLADHDTLTQSTFDLCGAERTGIEVHEDAVQVLFVWADEPM